MNDNTKSKLREDTTKWLEMDNLINKLKLKIKDMEKEKMIIADRILEVMTEFDISDLNIANHQLKYRSHKKKQGISKKFLLENLTSLYNGDMQKAIDTIDFLESKRSCKMETKLLGFKKKNLIT